MRNPFLWSLLQSCYFQKCFWAAGVFSPYVKNTALLCLLFMHYDVKFIPPLNTFIEAQCSIVVSCEGSVYNLENFSSHVE